MTTDENRDATLAMAKIMGSFFISGLLIAGVILISLPHYEYWSIWSMWMAAGEICILLGMIFLYLIVWYIKNTPVDIDMTAIMIKISVSFIGGIFIIVGIQCVGMGLGLRSGSGNTTIVIMGGLFLILGITFVYSVIWYIRQTKEVAFITVEG